MSANAADLLAAAIVAVPVAFGIKDGLVSGLLRAGAVLAACALAAWKLGPASAWVVGALGFSALGASVAVLGSALLAGWAAGHACAWLWKKASAGTLGWADRLAGGLAGAIKGLLAAIVVLSAGSLVSPSLRASVRTSWIGTHAAGPLLERSRGWLEGRLDSWRRRT